MKELEGAMSQLKKNKAAGHDHVINEFIINLSLGAKKTLLAIFNNIMQLKYFPDSWAIGNIVPIFKSGDHNDANNYRGITLLSCLSKLFTGIMNNRLNKWADKGNVLSEAQFGFRKDRGTVDCIFILHGIVKILLARGKKVYCCFVDYEKAYDYLDRAAIFHKLLKNGVSSKCIDIFRDMYDRMQLGVIGSPNTEVFPSKCGLLQGETTSPLFFSFFVNDIENCINDELTGIRVQDILIKLLMFADDMVILSETREGLQRGINELEEYCLKWGITVNTRKTKVMIFRKGGKMSQRDKWTYGGNDLEVVPAFKYLGIYLTPSGSFTRCTRELVISARRALFALKKQIATNPEIQPRTQIELFQRIISPVLLYCSEIWGLCKAEAIETFHISFLKNLLGVKKSTPNCYIYGELGLFPLAVERKIRAIKYWAKIIDPEYKGPSYIRRIYTELLNLSEISPTDITWVTQVRDTLRTCGMGDIWESQAVVNIKMFMSLFKQRIQDIYRQEWRTEVMETSDNRLFKHMKVEFQFEKYLEYNSRGLNIAISRIRLGSHYFMIERGRWDRRKPDLADRKCQNCNCIEDEFHVLVECPKYSNVRKNLIPNKLKKRPSMFEFLKFLNSQDEKECKKLGILCTRVLKEYKKDLQT